MKHLLLTTIAAVLLGASTVEVFGEEKRQKQIASSNKELTGSTNGGTVFVTLVSHFDRPWTMSSKDLAALQTLTKNHPKVRWTHLFNPVSYTTPTPLLENIETFLKESQKKHFAEIGVHLHMYQTFVEGAGVEFRIKPSVSAKQAKGSFDRSGYSVPMSAYTGEEILLMLDCPLTQFKSRGFGVPKTFCAGFYTTSLELQNKIALKGFTSSAAAFPPGKEVGSQYAPSWHELAGWDTSVTIRSVPYRISKTTILPTGTQPFIQTVDGNPLVEIPQNCKIDWMVTAEDMKMIINHHVQFAKKGRSTAVCLAIHEGSADRYFTKFNDVLEYVDNLSENRNVQVKVQYATVSQVRAKFIEYWK